MDKISNLWKEKIFSLFFILFITVLLVQLFWIFNSDGFYMMDDGAHFNYNRHFLENPAKCISFWHRIGRVLLYVIPAKFGLKGVQLAASIVFFFTLYFSYKILKEKKIQYPEWIFLFVGFQPVFFNISYSSLAEIPAAFLIVLGYYLHLREKYISAMIISSFIFTFRTEMYIVAILYFLLYFQKRKWIALPFIFIGPLFWFILDWILTGNISIFFGDMLMYNKIARMTPGIKWYYYLEYSPVVFGIITLLFFLIGTIFIIVNKKINDFYLIFLIIFWCIAFHTIAAVDWFVISPSIGDLRYIAIVSPLVGIISVYGFSITASLFKGKTEKIILATGLVLIFFLFGPFTTPFHKKFEVDKVADRIIEFRNINYPDYPVLSQMPAIANAMDEPAFGSKNYKKLNKSNIENSVNAIIVFDKGFENVPFISENVTLDFLNSLNGNKLIDSVNEYIDRKSDIPSYYFNDYQNNNINEFLFYYTTGQYTNENLNIKYFKYSNPSKNK